AVGDRAVVVEAGEDFLHLAHHVLGAGDVEEGFLLAGERGVGQVFGGGRGAHRDRYLTAAIVGAELRVSPADVCVESGLQRRVDYPATDRAAGAGRRA